ncbi:Multicopper oxidase, C-terminal [Dillenia turbinata]|uniref:Multicopper oxidase, C-terminal n=1 Tax=Dillenia turbinata TaxID=194707 RepID=A0AAN8VP79_9MAGN
MRNLYDDSVFDKGHNTDIRLADQHNQKGVYKLDFPNTPLTESPKMDRSVINATYKGFVKIVFQNNDTVMKNYHLDGHSFFVIGMNYGNWTDGSRPGEAIQISLNEIRGLVSVKSGPLAWGSPFQTFLSCCASKHRMGEKRKIQSLGNPPSDFDELSISRCFSFSLFGFRC